MICRDTMKKNIILLLAVILSSAAAGAAVPSLYNVRKFGARGDGSRTVEKTEDASI